MLRREIVIVVSLLIAFFSRDVFATALTANFGEIVVQELRIGYPFSLKERAHLTYIITNPGSKPIEVKIEIKAPLGGKVKKGYEPIPDVSWIKLEKDFFIVNPNEQVSTDIVFNIPKDEKLIDKKYQVSLFPYTFDGILRIQVESNILFTISKETEPYPTFLGVNGVKERATFDLEPLEFNLENISLGKKIDIAKVLGKSLKITNTSDRECTFYLNTRQFAGFYADIKQGYVDTPDPHFLSFEQESITIKPNESKQVKLFLKFPDDKKYKGKKYGFLIPVVLGHQEVPMVKYLYLYVTTKP